MLLASPPPRLTESNPKARRDPIIDAGVGYIEKHGLWVFLLAGKVPFAGSHAHLDAVSDIDAFRRMRHEHPAGANLAISHGPSGTGALDYDSRNDDADRSGFQRLREFVAGHPTTVLRTGDGIQLFYCRPADWQTGNWHNIAPGLDFKGPGGYSLLPPSRHPTTGRHYE